MIRAALLLVALALPAAAQEAADPGVAAAAAAGVTCQPNGYEVVVHHGGSAALPEGTVIGWNVPFARMQGEHVLTRALEPGGMVALSAVLGSSYITPTKPCIASILSPGG